MALENPFELILSELEEIKTEIRHSKQPALVVEPPDRMTVDQAIKFLTENGVPLGKGMLYNLTAGGKIPCSRLGKRLVFSRKNLMSWIESQIIEKRSKSQIAAERLANSAKRRERS
ncbi:helix-turn-helix domain-containing protein [Maribellus sp. YY47]|uniref:helix-turn-helix domain-containing protein n=1 Tax=Maribellus sp. YY47 TaxID=2929486 RepID=UPI0020015667|nr:helix-turn-helix domain-containing protein [Maribellus sp. YY47]MCK3682802.1 helix-turn-helix domain-containing protein [Maribellus sp. YY47]